MNRKVRKSKKSSTTKISPKRSLLRRMSRHSLPESSPSEAAEPAAPSPASILKRRSSPSPSPASKKGKSRPNSKAAKANKPKPSATEKPAAKARAASAAGKAVSKRKAPARASDPKSSATEETDAKRSRVGHFALACVTYRSELRAHYLLPSRRSRSNQVNFEHDENTQPVKDFISYFNQEQGNDAGSFKITAYWSRGDMALSMKDSENKKMNVSCMMVHAVFQLCRTIGMQSSSAEPSGA